MTTTTVVRTTCAFGTHPIVCGCGHTLEAIPTHDNDWAYRSTETGNVIEITRNPILERYTWAELAALDPALYSRLSAQDKLGTVDVWHTHTPADCPEPHDTSVVPDCCTQPMRLAPSGWVCRVNPDHKENHAHV